MVGWEQLSFAILPNILKVHWSLFHSYISNMISVILAVEFTISFFGSPCLQ